MANDGTVKIGTELDQSGRKKGLSGLGRFASKGFGVVGGAAKAMAGVTMGALAAVGTGMGALVVSGIKYNAAMEMYTANFSTMLGSEEAAIAKVNELKKLGASTPFEMADLATATTTLLAFGVEADKSTEILTMLGDVSLGSKEKLDRLSNSFGKVQSQGKLTGETAQMMIEAGFNPLKVIAETTGESMTDLTDRMAKGAISADEVTAAFKKATSQGGQFYKGMETASTTFDGLISTLKDNAGSLVGEVVKPISDSMTKTLLPKAIGMIQTLTDGFAKDGIPGLIDAAGEVVGKIITGIAEQAPAVIQMASGFLTTLLNALMLQLPTLSTAGVGIVTGLLNAILTNLPLLFTLGITLLTNLITGIAAALPQLIPAAQTAILTMVQTLMDNLPAILTAGMQILTALIQGIAGMLPTLIGYLPALITTIVGVIVDNLPMIITAAIQILLALITGLAQAIPQLVAMLPTLITTIVDTLLANLPAIITAAIQILVALILGLSQAIPQLVDMLPEIITNIVDTLIDNLPLIIEAAVLILGAVITGLIQAIPSLIAAIPQIVTAIFDEFGKIDWLQIGKDIIDGIINGIKNVAGTLATAATNAANSAIDGVKKFLGIHSPSLLTRKVLGRPIIEGVGRGIEDESGGLEDTAVGTMRNTVTAMQGVPSADMVGQFQWQAISRSNETAALRALRGDWASSNLPRASDSGKTGPETIVIPVYIGDELIEEIVVHAADNYAIKKNR